jgi:nucleotide-binding universal stress UspA family protein
MKILVLAKMDDHDKDVHDFLTNYLADDSEIHLLNVIKIPSEIPLQMNGEVIEFCTEYNLSKYYEEKSKHQEILDKAFPELNNITANCLIGNPLQLVKWYVKEHKIDLVVSGGHVTTHLEDIFSSSFANHLMQSLSVPYLSIKGTHPQLKKIAIVREFVDPAQRSLELIKKIQGQCNAKIVLVKINTPNSHMDAAELKQKMELFAQLNGLTDPEFLTIEASDKETAIKDLISKHEIDLLTLGHIHRNGISSFLRGDLRSDILNHVNVPIYMY